MIGEKEERKQWAYLSWIKCIYFFCRTEVSTVGFLLDLPWFIAEMIFALLPGKEKFKVLFLSRKMRQHFHGHIKLLYVTEMTGLLMSQLHRDRITSRSLFELEEECIALLMPKKKFEFCTGYKEVSLSQFPAKEMGK